MNFDLPVLNYLGVLISAIVMMVIGAIWYGPLFGNLWMKGRGMDPEDATLKDSMKKSAGSAYLQMFIGALLMSFVLSYFFGTWSSGDNWEQAVSGMFYGALAWLGFALPIIYGKKLWEGKQFKYVAIDLGYYLVSLLVIGMIIAIFAKMDLEKTSIESVDSTISGSLELDREIKEAVFAKVDTATNGEWDYEIYLSEVDPTKSAAVGQYQAKDWWDWFAFKNEYGWNIMVSLDGWDCKELDSIHEEYKQLFDDYTYKPSPESQAANGRYCYDHQKKGAQVEITEVEAPVNLVTEMIFSPDANFSASEKKQLMQNLLNPFIDWTNNEMRSSTEKVKLTTVTVEKSTSSEFKYDISAIGNVKIDFVHGEKSESGTPVWTPDCLGECEFPDWYAKKYPEVVKAYSF